MLGAGNGETASGFIAGVAIPGYHQITPPNHHHQLEKNDCISRAPITPR